LNRQLHIYTHKHTCNEHSWFISDQRNHLFDQLQIQLRQQNNPVLCT